VGAPRWSSEPREAGRADTLTIFFEIRSNFSKNEHHLGNGEIVGCGARNAAARCERRKGKIQVRREPPEKRMKKNAKISPAKTGQELMLG